MKKKNEVIILSVAAFFMIMSLWAIFSKTVSYSESERRVLASFPDVTIENIISGEFSKEFDDYAVERFPGREQWRRIKAYIKTKLFMQKDNHNIYTSGKHISKMEYPMNRQMMDYAIQLFSEINDKYLKQNEIYLAVIPDKNKYLAEETGHLSFNYDEFSTYFAENMSFANYIEISDLLDAEDYYYTDSHWRQENIVDVAERIADAMGVDISQTYTAHTLDLEFYGVYAGQSALNCEPDHITYLSCEMIENAKVIGAKAVYDMTKAKSRDPYEIFLSGNQSVVTITNASCENPKRLIIFRDSFGSSIAPLFMKGYSEITLVDLRYISSSQLSEYVSFEDADILFLYSTMLLNHSLSMK